MRYGRSGISTTFPSQPMNDGAGWLVARCRRPRAAAFMRATLLGCCGLWLVLLGQIPPAIAGSLSSAFIVADVPVDATAEDGVRAREAARAAGVRRAFLVLLKRLTKPEDWDHLPNSAADRALDYVQDMEVKDEHALATRYLGTYTFRFSPKSVTRILRDSGLAVYDTPSKPVVILPVLSQGALSKLWDPDNPWRQAWTQSDRRAGLVPWINAKGDAQDAGIADAAQLLANPPPPIDKLAPFSLRYRGAEVVIAAAQERDTPEKASLQMMLTRYAPDGTQVTAATAEAPKADAKLFKAAVEAAETALETLWKAHQPLATPTVSAMAAGDGNAQTLIVAVPITGPRDWAMLREKLAHVPGVLATQLVAFTKGELRVKLKLSGSPPSLLAGFQQQDLALDAKADMGSLTLLHGGNASP